MKNALITAALVTFLTTTGVAAERGGHVAFNVCHKTGNGYILLKTADTSSYEAHIAHGDVPPGEDGTCPSPVTPVPTEIPVTPEPTDEPTSEATTTPVPTTVPTQPVPTDVPVTEVPTDEPVITTPVPTATDGPGLPPPPVPTTPGGGITPPSEGGPEVVAPGTTGGVQPGEGATEHGTSRQNDEGVAALPSAGSGPMDSYTVPVAFAVIGATLAASAIGIRRKV